jgi:cytochrome bd ubiquinol oxidase subunit II
MLETIWFLLWGVLWAVYFMLDGFDLGLGTLLPLFGRTEKERRIIHSAVGPYWDGNEVWLITAGGVTFAAFPGTYAVLFSAFYTPLMLILFALIMRAVSFEFRNKREGSSWRLSWDMMAAVASFVAALLFGVAFANIFKGIPIDKEGVYEGTLVTLLNPYGIAGGLFFLIFFLLHGSLWLSIKADGPLQEKAVLAAKRFWAILTCVAILFFVITAFYTDLYHNYLKSPFLFVIPFLTVCSLFAVRLFLVSSPLKSWWASSITIMGTTLFGIIGLYPRMLPSSLDPSFSLTIFNSASSALTLKIMLIVALVFVPIAIIYQSWAYVLFKGKIRDEDVEYE